MSSTPNPQPETGVTGATDATTANQPRRTRKIGIVVSNKMEKTVVVEVSRTVKHERYGRYQKKSARFLADDRVLKAQPGDTVQIEETRPLSARKRWRVTAIVTKGRQPVSDTADVPGSAKKVAPKAVPDKKLAGKPAKRSS